MPRRPLPAPVRFGTAYYPDHWPEEQWAADLDRIVAAGLQLVRFGEFSWSWYEPAPDRFDFAAFHRFVALVEERDLQLCLCTPTATPPPWFDALFPDGRLQDMHGRRCLAPRHFWCWNHPAAWERAVVTITRLAQEFAGQRCLWGWQIDNEPNYAEQIHRGAPEAMYDHNPYARRAWVAWLRARYNDSLAALNAAWWGNFWSQRYSQWEELLLPRGRVNPHAWLDWMRWREENLAQFVHRQRDLLRQLTPGRAVGCNIPETGVDFSLHIGQDYWRQAEGLDWVGTDVYRATGHRRRDLERQAYSTDLLRSAADAAGAAFVISETQAGPHERSWPNSFAGEGFAPDYLERCAKIFAARGARQIWWFLWRPTWGGQEIGMNGLQSLDGSDSSRTDAVQRLARQGTMLARSRQRFLQRPRAVVHYARDSLRFWSAFVPDAQALEENFAGWHALLEQAGFRVDFVSDAGVHELDTDDLLVLPFSLLAGPPQVADFVRHRGPLFLGPHTAVANEQGHLCPTRLAERLAEHAQVDFGLWRDVGRMPRLPQLPAISGWRELLPRTRGKVTGRFAGGQPLLVRHHRVTAAAVDLGEIAARASRSQRGQIIQWLPRPSGNSVRGKAPLGAP